jgi:hypothetical protein
MSKPSFLERNPHLRENYLRLCEDLGVKPGELPEEVAVVSRDKPSPEVIAYFKRLHGVAVLPTEEKP